MIKAIKKKLGTELKVDDATTIAIRNAAPTTGKLPHELLLQLARGESIAHTRVVQTLDPDGVGWVTTTVVEQFYASMDQRIDCMKAAAPYFTPKLVVQSTAQPEDLGAVLLALASKLPV